MSEPAPAEPRPLAEALELLRTIMADERRAIARLDLDAIAELTARKQALAPALTTAADRATRDPALARLVVQLRIELGANAALLRAASEAVAVLLGQEPNQGYDRMARRQGAFMRPRLAGTL